MFLRLGNPLRRTWDKCREWQDENALAGMMGLEKLFMTTSVISFFDVLVLIS